MASLFSVLHTVPGIQSPRLETENIPENSYLNPGVDTFPKSSLKLSTTESFVCFGLTVEYPATLKLGGLYSGFQVAGMIEWGQK